MGQLWAFLPICGFGLNLNAVSGYFPNFCAVKGQFPVSGILRAGGTLDNKDLLCRNYLFNFSATFSPANNSKEENLLAFACLFTFYACLFIFCACLFTFFLGANLKAPKFHVTFGVDL